MERPFGIHIDAERDVLMPFAAGGLVETQSGDRRWVVPFARFADPVVEHGPDPLGVDAQHLGHPLDGHLPLD